MVGDKRKKSKIDERGEGEDFDHIDEQLVIHIQKLREVQDRLEKINEEASDKVLEVEQKYSEIRSPVYSRRKEIIQLIPNFWLTAILNHPVLGDLINDNDHKILKHLVSLDVEDFKDVKSGYSITFNFSPNPYFEGEKLTKTIFFSEEATTNITGSEIKWKQGLGNTNGSGQEKKGSKRPFEEDSFFNWFNDAQQKSALNGVDDEVAEIIKEDLWPNPLKYFNNEADEEDFDGEDDEDKGTDDDDDDDDDDDGDDDDDDEDDLDDDDDDNLS